PDVALLTPFTCWNTACTPQKQPPAKTMRDSPLVEASVSSTAGSGNAVAVLLDAPGKGIANHRSNSVTTAANAILIGVLMSIVVRRRSLDWIYSREVREITHLRKCDCTQRGGAFFTYLSNQRSIS